MKGWKRGAQEWGNKLLYGMRREWCKYLLSSISTSLFDLWKTVHKMEGYLWTHIQKQGDGRKRQLHWPDSFYLLYQGKCSTLWLHRRKTDLNLNYNTGTFTFVHNISGNVVSVTDRALCMTTTTEIPVTPARATPPPPMNTTRRAISPKQLPRRGLGELYLRWQPLAHLYAWPLRHDHHSLYLQLQRPHNRLYRRAGQFHQLHLWERQSGEHHRRLEECNHLNLDKVSNCTSIIDAQGSVTKYSSTSGAVAPPWPIPRNTWPLRSTPAPASQRKSPTPRAISRVTPWKATTSTPASPTGWTTWPPTLPMGGEIGFNYLSLSIAMGINLSAGIGYLQPIKGMIGT